MKLMLLSLGIVGLMLAAVSGRTAYPVEVTEIKAKLCPKSYCVNHFDDMTVMMCGGVGDYVPPGNDYVFGLFHREGGDCMCPCNLPKYFP